MSLGGYKFAGRYCNRGSLSDTQWILLMHKTKVAAFLASNALSNAGWVYHMTGSPDGNYHCLDSVGNNYVTCFYNASQGSYFAIYTLCNHTYSGTDSGMVQVLLNSHSHFTTNGTVGYLGKYASNFFRISLSEITYLTPLNTVPNLCSRLLPVGNLGVDTSNEGSSGYGKTNTLFSQTSVMFGYAIKKDDIIMFSGVYNSGGTQTEYLCTSIAPAHAYSQLVNKGDKGTILILNTQSPSSTLSNTYENHNRVAPVSDFYLPVCQQLGADGMPANSSGLINVPQAIFFTNISSVPFQALSTYYRINDSTGIWGKGDLKLDLVAVNYPGHQNGLCPSLYSTVAKGNYLCVRYSGSNSSSQDYGITAELGFNISRPRKLDIALYVGWDPSNPDITQANAWTEYTG